MNTSRPWVLRDCRRLLEAGRRNARRFGLVTKGGDYLWTTHEHENGLPSDTPLGRLLSAAGSYHMHPGAVQARVLDQLIGVFGPDALVEHVLRALGAKREQAERTDHKIGPDADISDGPHTIADADTHGGDGNSGEMDHTAETSSSSFPEEEKPRDGQADSQLASSADSSTAEKEEKENTPQHSSPNGQPSSSVAVDDASSGSTGLTSGSSSMEGQPTGQGQKGPDEGTRGMGSQTAAGDAAEADKKASGKGRSAQIDAKSADQGSAADDGCPKREAKKEAAGEAESPVGRTSRSPFTASRTKNYNYKSQEKPKEYRSVRSVRDVARMARALSRLVADATRREPSPLWDGRRVVLEMVSRQVRLHRMRRDIRAPRSVLVLYDLSGSCSWIAEATWNVATALAERYVGLLAAPTCSPASGLRAKPAGAFMHEGSLDPSEIVGRGQIAAAARKLPAIIEHGADVDGWRRLRTAGVSHMLVLGDAHGQSGYRAAAKAGIRVLWANPNPNIAPENTSWCAYTLIEGGDIASAVEALTSRSTL